MMVARDGDLVQASGTKGLEIIGDKLTMPVQIEKLTQWHNKLNKAQDYVVAP
jgi:hypothetical protein